MTRRRRRTHRPPAGTPGTAPARCAARTARAARRLRPCRARDRRGTRRAPRRASPVRPWTSTGPRRTGPPTPTRLGPVEHFVVQEELARARAPELVGRIGVNLAGPTLLARASPAQKQRWLPHILSADELWCQLFSEPGAGSDLASVSTRATAVEGGWTLNGQKVWTSYAQFADWGVCLARTDPEAPKQRGISYLVVDMRAAGVEVRPLRQITDESEFNEVFFSDVFVPREHLIGAENEGWRIASSTLSHERGVNPRQLVIHIQLVEELLRLALD